MRPSPRTISFAVTAALHVAAVVALLQLDAVRKPLLDAVPLMVKLITPPKPEPPPPPPKALPPKPRPVVREPQREPPPRPVESPPLLVSESPAPTQAVAAPPPRPEPAPPAPAPVAAPPAPVVPPSFNAAYLQNPPPAYPLMSRRRGEKGTVLLRVYVSAQGAVEQVEVRTSSGHELLDEAALNAVRRWRFVPARQGDRPVAAWVLVPIVFTLEG